MFGDSPSFNDPPFAHYKALHATGATYGLDLLYSLSISEVIALRAHNFANGDVYLGQWGNGKMNGVGVYTFASGRRYEGHWSNNEKRGKGRETFPDGSLAHGNFKKDRLAGEGTFMTTDKAAGIQRKSEYSGRWKAGKRHGKGNQSYSTWRSTPTNVDRSEVTLQRYGSFKGGMADDKGSAIFFRVDPKTFEPRRMKKPSQATTQQFTILLESLAEYEDYLYTELHLKPNEFGDDEDLAAGQFDSSNTDRKANSKKKKKAKKKAKKKKKETKHTDHTDKDKGTARKDAKTKPKSQKPRSRSIKESDLETLLEAGAEYGVGLLRQLPVMEFWELTVEYFESGDKFVGQIQDGVEHGVGIYAFNDGSRYEGYWKDGKRHGAGIETQSDGRKEKGLFDKDVLIQEAETEPTFAGDVLSVLIVAPLLFLVWSPSMSWTYFSTWWWNNQNRKTFITKGDIRRKGNAASRKQESQDLRQAKARQREIDAKREHDARRQMANKLAARIKKQEEEEGIARDKKAATEQAAKEQAAAEVVMAASKRAAADQAAADEQIMVVERAKFKAIIDGKVTSAIALVEADIVSTLFCAISNHIAETCLRENAEALATAVAEAEKVNLQAAIDGKVSSAVDLVEMELVPALIRIISDHIADAICTQDLQRETETEERASRLRAKMQGDNIPAARLNLHAARTPAEARRADSLAAETKILQDTLAIMKRRAKAKALRDSTPAHAISHGSADAVVATPLTTSSAGRNISDSSSDDDEWEASTLQNKASFVSRGESYAEPAMTYTVVESKVTKTSRSGDVHDSDVHGSGARGAGNDENMMCIICWETPRNMLCLPCRHLQLCEQCSSSCSKCPSCRADVQQYLKVFT